MIGYFFNNIMPFRIGDIIKSFIISQKAKIKTSYVIGTLLLEKICDMVGLLIISTIFLIIFYNANWNVILSGYIFNLLVICLLGFIFVGITHSLIKSKFFITISNKIKLLDKFISFIKNTLISLMSIKNNDYFKIIFFQTFIIWIIHYFITFFVVSSILNIHLNWIQIGLLRIIIFFTALIPSAPGNIGTYHAAAIYILTNYYYIPKAEALTFSIIMHAVGYFPVVIIGLIYFIKEFEEILAIYKTKVFK
jgi:uncharacterized membrane protein YbhN (UPF0104 family)